MKKYFRITATILVIAIMTLCISACQKNGGTIVYTTDYDLSNGVVDSLQKEIEFSVASFNVQGGKLSFEKADSMRNLLQSKNVDIAGLQEMDHLSKRTNKSDFLTRFLHAPYNFAYFSSTKTIIMGETYGNSVVSKTQLNDKLDFLLPYPYEKEKIKIEKRIVSRVLTIIDGVQIAFYNTHLSYENIEVVGNKTLRSSQIDYIIELMKNDPVPYKVLAGDFNVESYSEYDVFHKMGFSMINTIENPFSTYREEIDFGGIDNIIFSKNLNLLSCEMVDSPLSDHNPLFAKFKTKYVNV